MSEEAGADAGGYMMCYAAELGDYDADIHSAGYTSEFDFIPSQTEEFEDHVAMLHRRLVWGLRFVWNALDTIL